MKFSTLALIMALVGTGIQAYWRLRTIRDVERDISKHFVTVRELIEEVAWWRPVQRFRRKREVLKVLSERPEELLMYQRVYWELVGWVLLVVASLLALLGGIL